MSDVGVSIRQNIQDHQDFTWNKFRIFLNTFLLNLSRLHVQGYIHFNIHSGNVCIKHSCCHLIDFALTEKMDFNGAVNGGLRPTSVFRAPEICHDGPPLTAGKLAE
ncbi:hypothetical protein BC833DRAFT_602686 [Globomyces pollinis-pini]|nr:hypothetical protein BC833DRAFT_602686 [Globomyces pollinis-pini]